MQRWGERVYTRALESHRHCILIQEGRFPMGTIPTSPTSIKDLLDRLKEKPDEQVGLTALRGRALSRSAHNLHLAISGGIVAVPIANIQEVTSLGKAQPDVVQLLIRNPQEPAKMRTPCQNRRRHDTQNCGTPPRRSSVPTGRLLCELGCLQR